MKKKEIVITCIVFTALLALALFDIVLSNMLSGFIHLSLAAVMGNQFIRAINKTDAV